MWQQIQILLITTFFNQMSAKDDDFCTLSANGDGKCKTDPEDLMVSATGWKIPIFIEKPSESSTLEKFLHIQPPKKKKSKFIKDGEIFMIPGLPETLDKVNHLGRSDETDDSTFYSSPRLVTHIDENAIEALVNFYRKHLKWGSSILDLCTSWISHLPEEMRFKKVLGIGMNEHEMRENKKLTEALQHDLNKNPNLGEIEDESLDTVLCTVSVDYLVHPLKIFSEVYRVLKPGGKFIISFSNRFFPSKVINAWRFTKDHFHIYIVATYFQYSAKWSKVEVYDITQKSSATVDPMFVVQGFK